uniref:BTB domain-containing protein n=1 Tax=Panagrolaimus sp. ES5 TaxID=591445 RepID=A0AC34FHL7_9BILA
MITAGSDVFEAILNSSETRNSIDIPDFDEFVVKDAIKFIYGQKPPQAYYQLYRFSNLYSIRQLMDFCELYFEKNLGPNNVIQQALENDRGHLRHFCVVFYKSNKENVEKEETFLKASEETKNGLIVPFVLGP